MPATTKPNSPIWPIARTQSHGPIRTGQKGTEAYAEELADDHHAKEQCDQSGMLEQHIGVNQHPHCDEEHGREHIAHTFDAALDLMACTCLGEDRAG
jgi:hypothetical protein